LSNAWAETSTTEASTGASADGAEFLPSTLRTPSRSVGTSALNWQITADLSRTSEVEITLVPEDQQRTRVTLVHRHIDRHGHGWESLRDGLEAQDGWPLYLGRYEALTRGELDAS